MDGEAYSTEATEALIAMTSGQVVQCQPAAVAENNVPYIHVLSQRDHQVSIRFSKMAGNLKSLHILWIVENHTVLAKLSTNQPDKDSNKA